MIFKFNFLSFLFLLQVFLVCLLAACTQESLPLKFPGSSAGMAFQPQTAADLAVKSLMHSQGSQLSQSSQQSQTAQLTHGSQLTQSSQLSQHSNMALMSGTPFLPEDAELASFFQTLDELAELERAGAWFQGLGISESGIRERAGDYAGAVAAAFKEMSWAYGLGFIQKHDLEQGLFNVFYASNDETVKATASAIISFVNGKWDEAASGLEPLFGYLENYEPDGFCRWMLLVCSLEKNKAALIPEERRTVAAYRSIRARYMQFPEYWYRGARVFSGAIAMEFAENCINLSAQGPFANECRSILAFNSGIRTEDSLSIKTKREIETIISQSINSGNPQILDTLLPLISLPDNSYTVYAVGLLRTVTGIPGFRDYFNGKAATAAGRLAERLSYICRG